MVFWCSTKERIPKASAPTRAMTVFATDALVFVAEGVAHRATRATWMTP